MNDVECRNSPYCAFFSPNSIDFKADYITVSLLAKPITHPAARSLRYLSILYYLSHAICHSYGTDNKYKAHRCHVPSDRH